MSQNGQFPFHYLNFPQNGMPFVEQVKTALKNDLQNSDQFGCNLHNCHTHAGSKLHFLNFIEAELLFHNNYYNTHFAQLTVDLIIELIEKAKEDKQIHINNLLLIGYENYSELYLHEVIKAIDQRFNNAKQQLYSNYFVYETVPPESRNNQAKAQVLIRNLYRPEDKEEHEEGRVFHKSERDGDNFREFKLDDTMFLFIVPINTSLSTMDKMVAKFVEEAGLLSYRDKILREHLCLITLQPEKTDDAKPYWTMIEEERKKYLVPAEKKFEYLNPVYPDDQTGETKGTFPQKIRIHCFVFQETQWKIVNQCTNCFPDLIRGDLTQEMPLFGVNRGSVVPMLKVGTKNNLIPIAKQDDLNLALINLDKVWALSKYVAYGHIVRGHNHFQYYIDIDGFIKETFKLTTQDAEKDKDSKGGTVESFFSQVKKELESSDGERIFNYIVAPRHRTNATWIHRVNSHVFDGNARIIYFDADKEYRSNVMTKYSDFIAALQNIQSSKECFQIRFHYVDDTIKSGFAFLRAKNLMSSLVSCIKDRSKVSLFYSVILCVNRLSQGTRRFYLDSGRFYSYVNVNISPMRRHDDACTLCKIIYDYHQIRNECATNELANRCSEVIFAHREQEIYDYENTNRSDFSILEKRFIFFISHHLADTLANRIIVNSIHAPIETECDSRGILGALNALFDYEKICRSLKKKFHDELGVEYRTGKLLWEMAFIKAISRPFFTYHIRQRQAAFSFCLMRLDDLLNQRDWEGNSDKDTKYHDGKAIGVEYHRSIMIQTLVKALADMNANYLVRQSVLQKLEEEAKTGNDQKNKVDKCLNDYEEKDLQFIKKRIFDQQSLLHYLKKLLILSRDTSKSLLLENILLKGTEKGFFGQHETEEPQDTVSAFYSETNDSVTLTLKGYLYLENNTIFKDIFQNSKAVTKNVEGNTVCHSDNTAEQQGIESETHRDLGRDIMSDQPRGNLTKLIDGIEKLEGTSLVSAEELPYFFNNFSEIWRVNTEQQQSNKVREILSAYQEIITVLEKYADKKSTEWQLSDWDKRIENLLHQIANSENGSDNDDSLTAITFVHDRDQKNSLFEFSPLDDTSLKDKTNSDKWNLSGISVGQAFLHEDNLKAIREVCEKQELWSVAFIKDPLEYNDSKWSTILRFYYCPEGPATLNRDSGVGESIYIQIWGLDLTKPSHWFALKILLTLREKFINLIRKNLKDLIKRRTAEMQAKALSITKATTHGNAERYYLHEIFANYNNKDGYEDITAAIKEAGPHNGCDGQEQHIFRPLYGKIMSLKKDYQFILYDTYYQLLSDEFISSMYRKIIRGQSLFTEAVSTTYQALQDDVKIMFANPSDNDLLLEDGRSDPWVKDINTPELTARLFSTRNESQLKLSISFCNDSATNKKNCVMWDAPIIGLQVFFYIINLMAMNALEHGKAAPELKVSFGIDGVTFSNSLNVSMVDVGRKNLSKVTKIPPWTFDDKETHITYWTLIQASKISAAHQKNAIEVKPEIICDDGENAMFTVKFNFFSQEANYEAGFYL